MRSKKSLIRLFRSFSRSKKALVVSMAMISLIFVSAVTVKALTTKNAHNRAVVLFVGDSNITLGAQNIDWVLTWNSHNDNSYTPVFASRVGSAIRTPDCLDPVGCSTNDYWKIKLGEIFSKVNADAVVINLGVNDTFDAGTATTAGYKSYNQKIDWLMSAIPSSTKVLWTNLPCDLEPSYRYTGCQTVNYALANAPKRWPNLVVLNWNMVAYGHGEYINTGDVHYTQTGHAAWANFVVKALDARFPVPEN